MTKFEITCITRHGFNILHTEGIDAAAKVTYLAYTPGQACEASPEAPAGRRRSYDPRTGVKSEWLVPLANPGKYH